MKHEIPDTYYRWPAAGWWQGKEDIARKLSLESLMYQIADAREAAEALPENSGKYYDEISIYRQEIARRSRKAAR